MDDALPHVLGRYLLLKKLGEGGAGTVHFARVLGSSQPLVIKTLRLPVEEDSEPMLRFRHEATIAVSVSSPHVVEVYDVGRAGSGLYIAMQHIAGWPLNVVLSAFEPGESRVPIPLVLAWTKDALLGLAALHEAVHPETHEPLGVVHRDLSPRNLMINAEGRLVLIDLGLGRSNIQEWQTRAGRVMGTPGYMSPEQVTGGRIDHRSDLFALGMIIYEMLTLERFVPKTEVLAMLARSANPVFEAASAKRPEVPAALDAILARALSLRPEDRFSSAREMLLTIEALSIAPPESRPSLLPAKLLEILRDDTREQEQLLEGSLGNTEPAIEATVLIAQRDMTTESFTARVTLPLPPRPKRPKRPKVATAVGVVGMAVAAAVAIGLVIGVSISTEPEKLSDQPKKIADQPRASSIRNEEPERRSIEEEAPSRPKIQKEKSATKLRPSPRAEAVVETTTSDRLRALLRDAAALRKQKPERAKEIDELVTDASLWRDSDDPARATSALTALHDKLRNLAE